MRVQHKHKTHKFNEITSESQNLHKTLNKSNNNQQPASHPHEKYTNQMKSPKFSFTTKIYLPPKSNTLSRSCCCWCCCVCGFLFSIRTEIFPLLSWFICECVCVLNTQKRRLTASFFSLFFSAYTGYTQSKSNPML